jgi:hypothetical protein
VTDGGDVIPEDFDLKAAKSKPSSTPMDERDLCPCCGSPAVVSLEDGEYRCDSCLARFEEPAQVDDELIVRKADGGKCKLHRPSPVGDEVAPACHAQTSGEWMERDAAQYPHHERCQRCFGTVDHGEHSTIARVLRHGGEDDE